MNLEGPISQIKGVGEKRKEKFKKIRIESILDLLYYFPRDYEDLSRPQLFQDGQLGERILVRVEARSKYSVNRQMWKLMVVDQEQTQAEIAFFSQGYLMGKIKEGTNYYLYGDLKVFRGRYQMANPRVYSLWEFKKVQGIRPIYPQQKGLKQFEFEQLIQRVLPELHDLDEVIPKPVRLKYSLLSRASSLKEIHQPTSYERLLEAKKRMVFEEFFILQLSVFYRQGYDTSQEGLPMKKIDMEKILKEIPFPLTPGQDRSLSEIIGSLTDGRAMRRLLQGDVGSGKTMVAMVAMAFCIENGYQCAMMAPTEILASQHYQSALDFFKPFSYRVALLTGKTKAKDREEMLEDLKAGKIDILLGTHALIQDDVIFKKLGLVITDEQHRFGVSQREKLLEKAKAVHSLVMTATPIPRTYAMASYGDLDVSFIDTMPPGRKPVQTTAVSKSDLQKALDFTRAQLREGRQAYVVTPLIEENHQLDLESAIKTYQELKEEFKPFRVSLMHGQLSSSEKESIMEDFYQHKIDLLVSTTVIEVGVNVPNANVMLIYDAQQFGLAQLHQLRGRVGRGSHQSYCILYNSSDSEKSWERMGIMQETTNGLLIAEKDLSLRGAGDFFGTRQSGASSFFIGDVLRDYPIFKEAQVEARRFFHRYKWDQVKDTALEREIRRKEALISRT